MQIGPQDPTIDALDHLEKMIVIAPIDADEDKTKHLTKEHRSDRDQGSPTGIVRNFEFEHHDGDDDRDHPITESFHAASAHSGSILCSQREYDKWANNEKSTSHVFRRPFIPFEAQAPAFE